MPYSIATTKTEPGVRLKLTLAYIGTRLEGWQIQARGRTVQGLLEEALAAVLHRPVRVHGAARTDSGVHALEQVAHVDVPADRATLPWVRALNSQLPRDVAVIRAEVVDDGFHARYSALSKIYAYSLWHEYEWVLPQRRPFVWRVGRLDWQAMERAAAHLTGEVDFASFMNTGTPVRSTVRRMAWIRRDPGPSETETVWRLRADGFLKQMVRNIMGCLVAVGRGKLDPDGIPALLAARDRGLAPATAPARGLTLERIFHEDDAGQVAGQDE